MTENDITLNGKGVQIHQTAQYCLTMLWLLFILFILIIYETISAAVYAAYNNTKTIWGTLCFH